MALVHCRECGEMISESAPTCPKCGASQNTQQANGIKAKTGICILSFFIPIVGWVLYFVKKANEPEAAKKYGMWGIIGFVVSIFLNIIVVASSL